MTTPTEPRTTLTARTPEDLIAMVPFILGFRPPESMLMLTFASTHPTFHARVDLPDDAAELADMVACLVDPVRRHGVDRVVLIVYTVDAALASSSLHLLADVLEADGVDVVEMLRVCGDRWFPMLMPDHHFDDGIAYDERNHPF